MDLLAVVKDAGVLAGIICATEVIKAADAKKRFERLYVLIPAVLGVLAALALAEPLTWQQVLRQALIYGPVAAYAWKFGKTLVLGR